LSGDRTLTPTLSSKRERGEPPPNDVTGSLSRSRERARVRARALRQSQTDAEALLWSKLRSRQVLDLKFRRQHPIDKYFADFVCVEIGLIVELDGGQHEDAAAVEYDRKRTEELALQGFTVLRFWDNQVLTEMQAVLEKIYQVAQTLTPTLSRKRERE
jgi:very-short-patch-repair endonuclease